MKHPNVNFIMTEAKILEELIIDEKSGDKVIRAELKWQHAGIINSNNRRYKKAIIEREINRLKSSIEAKEVYGASYHPEDGVGEVDDVSHMWESIWMEPDGQCKGIVSILPTSRGKNVQAIVKAGGKLGVSSRGSGTTTQTSEMMEGKKVAFEDVNDDFLLRSPGDFVLNPSVTDAGFIKLLESQLERVEDSKHLEERVMEIKTKEDLKQAYPELVKEIEDDVRAEAKKVEEDAKKLEFEGLLKSAKEQWMTELEESVDKKLKSISEQKEKMVDAIRAVITMLAEIEGVVPLETVTEAEEEEEETPEEKKAREEEEAKKKKEKEAAAMEKKVEEADEIKTVADLRAAYPDLVKEIEDAAKEKEEPKGEDEVEEKLTESKKLELEEKDKLSKEKVLQEQKKIEKADLKEKGVIEPPDKKPTQLNEKQEKALYSEARSSGFQGTFAEWKQFVSKK